MLNYYTRLKKGDKAPDFKGMDQDRQSVSLKDFKGKKLIVYFYPKDDTPSCANQACNLRDNHKTLKKNGYEVIGVSADDEKKHRKFIAKYKLPFSLIADTDKEIIKAFDVWGEKHFMGRTFDGILRTTFIINEKGKIENIITKVTTKNHTEQILSNNL